MRYSDDAGVAVEVEIAEIKPVAGGCGVVCSGGDAVKRAAAEASCIGARQVMCRGRVKGLVKTPGWTVQ